jgi:hypothetical protein
MAAEHASLPVVFSASSRRGQETGSQGKPRTNAATISLSFGATTMWFKIVGCRYSITGFTYSLPTDNHDNVILKRASRRSRHFNLSRDYIVRLLNEMIAGCEGQDIRNWKSGEQ